MLTTTLNHHARSHVAREDFVPGRHEDAGLTRRFEIAFRQSFALFDVATGELRHRPADWLNVDLASRLGLLEEVHRRGRPEIIEDYAPIVLLAVPLPIDEKKPASHIAITALLSQPAVGIDNIAPAAHIVGVDAESALRWSQGRMVWPPHAALELARSLEQNISGARIEATLRRQLSNVSKHLLQSLEELSLLHRLTEQLTLSREGSDLIAMALEWLSRVVPAQSLAVHFCDEAALGQELGEDVVDRTIVWGDSPIATGEYARLIERLGPDVDRECLLLDGRALRSPTWFYSEVTQLICVPIRTATKQLGWLLALGHRPGSRYDETDFGVIESSLLSSVAAILSVHFGNLRLFYEQSEFFASVVKALSSTIDAKDPYTRGHSERVARVAVCLAKHLGCSEEELNTLYFGGLMHDIGKIGIDDAVLRKPEQLTPDEFEQIKQHPQLGYDILEGVKQLEHLLPVVLHHHENWNGQGYPSGLAGETCPKLARIAAVADAFDAMSSDRPYRKGMADDTMHKIFRDGAGVQWDPQVIEAFFAARDEIREIVAKTNAEIKPLVVSCNRAPLQSQPIEIAERPNVS